MIQSPHRTDNDARIDMADDDITDGVFTREHPMHEHCGSHDNHPEHLESTVEDVYGRLERWWNKCPGWETTHTVTVYDVSGRVVGTKTVDLRDANKMDGSTNQPALTTIYTSRAAGRGDPSPDEIFFGAATYAVAPEICPFDSDQCHEHLDELAAELEEY